MHQSTTATDHKLLVVSNRLPELRSSQLDARSRNVGGLVAALQPVLADQQGLWLGWSGRTAADAIETTGLDMSNDPPVAWLDFQAAWHRNYYKGFCNSVLWPLFHSFPERMQIDHAGWDSYCEVNQAFAVEAHKLVAADATIWTHDYHLLLLARCLRGGGHHGPMGLFLHIPFPAPDLLMLLPWASELLDALLDYDLLGFHTEAFADNFLRSAAAVTGATVQGRTIKIGSRRVSVRVFPIGVMPAAFQEKNPSAEEDVTSLMRAISPCELILGVDRLDYTKGIPERIMAFGKLLSKFPEWQRKVALVQISVPSRADIAGYGDERTRVEEVVGRINGQFGDTDWVPIRYLYRSYTQAQLSALYRAARIGYVTPLRDGMNLVAKEYVAAQNADDPGVLVLSKFAGAAAELQEAVLCNPWDIEGTAGALDFALRLEKPERKRRQLKLHETVCKTTATTWARDFLGALAHLKS